MKNIFKIFSENKKLSEENKILKAQNDALMNFKNSLEQYYNSIAGTKIIENHYNNEVVLRGTFTIDKFNLDMPIEICKQYIANDISEKIMPYIEFETVDNEDFNNKNLIGKLIIRTRMGGIQYED